MAVVDETPIESSVANGVTTVFPHLFTVLDADDLRVIGTLAGVVTEYQNGVDYTVSGVGSASGSVTFGVAPASGTILVRYRDTQLIRETDYQNNGDLLAATLNADLDRVWQALQDIFSGGKSAPTALRVPNGETVDALPIAADRASRVLAFDSNGDPVMIVGVDAGSAAALALDIASTAAVNKGAGLVGYAPTLAYGADTVGEALNLTVYAELFAQAGDTSNAEAFQRAIDAVNALGGGVVATRLRSISFHQAVVLKPNVIVQGLGIEKSVITTTTHSFHAFTDSNVSAPGAEVHGFTIQGPNAPAGTTNRGIFLDADSTTARHRFTNLRFKWLFRGLNTHQTGDVEYDNIEGEALLDSTIYIGEVAANRSGVVRMGRSKHTNSFTAEPASGGGVVVLAYADLIMPGVTIMSGCGPSTGAVNLHHGLYLRSVGNGDVGYVKGSAQKRGADLHVFSDNGAGEPSSGRITAVVVSDSNANYVGVRVDRCDSFTLKSGSRVSSAQLQGVYLSNTLLASVEAGVAILNCNRAAITSAEGSAAFLIDACEDFTAHGVVMKDTITAAAAYGQGAGFAFKGACPRYRISDCRHIFPAGAVGYYFVTHEAGSTVTYPAMSSNFQSGPQSFLNEGGTVVPQGQGVIENHTRISANVSPLLSVEQLHRWRVRDCWNEGARFAYESDGTNVSAWLTDNPVSSAWVVGDRWMRIAPAAGAVPGGRCVTSGTPGTWKYEAALAP